MKKFSTHIVLVLLSLFFMSCVKDNDVIPDIEDTTTVVTPAFDINSITDTYGSLAPFEKRFSWGPYNTHDPSVIKAGEYFYAYSTDASYGVSAPAGMQIRKSKDLIDWKFLGWVVDVLPAQGANFIKSSGGIPFNSLWAPYILKVGNEYRLYYSLTCSKPRLSVIGLLTSTSPEGPWVEKGLAVTSQDDFTRQTNAIDPTVVVAPSGRHFMYYGSAWDGIYMLKLNAETGLAETSGDKGVRVAQRGFTGTTINGNIEGPEIIYNENLNKYFLFIAYDWLETKYNVRVGRSDNPEGPFYDFHGRDVNLEEDHGPMILAPYKFSNHGGWQGTSHVSVFRNGNQFYMAHQGRPGVDRYFMVMHVRKVFWTEDGWPVVSPERYANTTQTTITQDEITGTWEQIILGYNVVPGYAEEQVSPDFQIAANLVLNSDGTINSDAASTWTYNAPNLRLTWSNGFTDKLIVERGRDWENKKECLVFTGLNNEGTAVWGKK